MNVSPTALLAHARTDAGKRAIRYSATSLICVGITQALIITFYNGFEFSEVRSNLTATMLTSIPAFALNKYWVWGKRGRAHMRREVLPFWLFVAIGLVLSTVAVKIMHTAWVVRYPVTEQPAILTNLTNIFAFGILWVLRFFLFDRLFHIQHDPPLIVEADDELAA